MKTTIILTTLISIGTARTRRRASSFCRTVAMMANPFAIARLNRRMWCSIVGGKHRIGAS